MVQVELGLTHGLKGAAVSSRAVSNQIMKTHTPFKCKLVHLYTTVRVKFSKKTRTLRVFVTVARPPRQQPPTRQPPTTTIVTTTTTTNVRPTTSEPSDVAASLRDNAGHAAGSATRSLTHSLARSLTHVFVNVCS